LIFSNTFLHDVADGYPDFPMPQQLRVDNRAGRMVVSCRGSNIDVTGQLAGYDDTEVTVPGGPARARGPSTGGPTRVDASLAALARLAEAGTVA
jgi:hypothetical protein